MGFLAGPGGRKRREQKEMEVTEWPPVGVPQWNGGVGGQRDRQTERGVERETGREREERESERERERERTFDRCFSVHILGLPMRERGHLIGASVFIF